MVGGTQNGVKSRAVETVIVPHSLSRSSLLASAYEAPAVGIAGIALLHVSRSENSVIHQERPRKRFMGRVIKLEMWRPEKSV
jgi:hypothetical protein